MEPASTTDPTQPTLPEAQDLPAGEYRQHREKGTSIADLVSARPEPESSPDATGTTEPLNPAAPGRDGAGRFVKGDGAAKPDGQEPAKATKAGNPRHDPKARVDELRAEIAELSKAKGETQRERDAIATELASLRAEREALKPKPEPAAPAREKFTFQTYEAWASHADNADLAYEDYIEERAVARVRHERKLEDNAKAETEARTQHAKAWTPFHEREAAFKATTPDYDAVIQRSPAANVQLGPWVLDVLQNADAGPALRYHLAQHPEIAREIADLSPAAAVRQLDALILSLGAASTVTAPATRPQTKADPPFETVGASASASTRSVETAAAAPDNRRYRQLREEQARH